MVTRGVSRQKRGGGEVGERYPEHVVVGLEAEGEGGLRVVEGEEVGGVGFDVLIDGLWGGGRGLFFGGKKVGERWGVGNVVGR
jgi:hypothetical protein